MQFQLISFNRDQRRHYDLSIAKLANVIDSMEELLILKNQYNLHVSFEDYYSVNGLNQTSTITSLNIQFYDSKYHLITESN